MNVAINMITKPRIGMEYFWTYQEAITWVNQHKDDIVKAGGKFVKTRMTIDFPNGNSLIIGYGSTDKYLGSEFLFIHGPLDDNLRSRIRI